MIKSDYWAHVDPATVPHIVTPPPGPRSQAYHRRATQHYRGLSSQVKLFPVVFESGHGVTLRDVDGNTYIDFTSGIYVTNLGHCHPKVTEAVQRAAATLMNCHDFTTPLKAVLVEKLAQILPGDLTGVQLYDSGTTAVEAGIRLLRAATGKQEFISFYRDFHGKTWGAVSAAKIPRPVYGLRAPGFFLVRRPHHYHCRADHTEAECARYHLDLIRETIEEETTGQMAGIILEPIQGWAGSIVPPDGFIQGLRKLCDERGILLMADEVLTGMGRTGKLFAMEHWETVPDVMTLGKGLGNGFPVTALVVSAKHMDAIDQISASTSYGGNPMACAAALACLEVIEEEDIVRRSAELGAFMLARMEQMQQAHPTIGEVRGKGCLLGIELVKDRKTKEPFTEAGIKVYQKAFQRGLAWIPAGHNLRIAPPLIMEKEIAAKGLDIIEEAIGETERELGYA